MNKEKAIKQLEIILQNIIEERKQGIASIEGMKFQEALQTVLNLIQKQDKIIDKFSKALVNCVGTCPIDYNDDFENDCENCQETLEKCWIEYFKKVDEEDE